MQPNTFGAPLPACPPVYFMHLLLEMLQVNSEMGCFFLTTVQCAQENALRLLDIFDESF